MIKLTNHFYSHGKASTLREQVSKQTLSQLFKIFSERQSSQVNLLLLSYKASNKLATDSWCWAKHVGSPSIGTNVNFHPPILTYPGVFSGAW